APFVPRGLSASRIGDVMAELIEARVRSWTTRSEIALLKETQELTLDIIFRIMGITSEDVSWWRSHYRSLFSAVLLDALRVPTYRRRAERIRQQIDDRMLGIIRAARQRPPAEGDGLVAALVHGRDETGRAT